MSEVATDKITVLYVGSSLLAPLRAAEREIEARHGLGLRVAAHNLGAPLADDAWREIERDFGESSILFVFHVTDGENAARLISLLRRRESEGRAVVVINCMPELMRRTRLGKLRFGKELDEENAGGAKGGRADGHAKGLVRAAGAWMGEQVRARGGRGGGRHTQYMKMAERLPALLRFVPNAGRLRDLKNYLQLFCYFLQPTPANVRSMLLHAAKHYGAGRARLGAVRIPPPESVPVVGIYHPAAPELFGSYEAYRAWYQRRAKAGECPPLDPENTAGLLLMRTQIIGGARSHYDGLIRAVESEGLAVLPVISTFMDNREACEMFFVAGDGGRGTGNGGRGSGVGGRPRFALRRRDEIGTHAVRNNEAGDDRRQATDDKQPSPVPRPPSPASRVSQIVSLTGFSFVGGPAMNDSEAAVEFLKSLNRPLRSAVSLDVQTVEDWRESWTGLNPVQAGMQVAIPEIDGATEPFVFGGMTAGGAQPVAIEERCRRMARRLRRWNHLGTAPRESLRLALVVFCFPPNKGSLGTAAELDVFLSLHEVLHRLKAEGYAVEPPASADALRETLLGDGRDSFGDVPARVAYRMSADEYLRLCPYAKQIEAEWGRAPGAINTSGRDLLIQGAGFGNVFVGVQPTFGYEGDPTRLLMARGGSPHHGFAALYTYIEKVFRADALVHVGTHGALEFMPGKQVGLSGDCWPDRLVGELPHVYLYSVNNPSEGSIARRRSYAELVSYLSPPVADAGLYRELSSLKEAINAYRQTADEAERERLFAQIEEKAAALHFDAAPPAASRPA